MSASNQKYDPSEFLTPRAKFAVTEIISSNTLAELNTATLSILRFNRPFHLSMWGIDKQAKRIFFAENLSPEIPFHRDVVSVIDFESGFLGSTVTSKGIKLVDARGANPFLAKSFLIKEKILKLIGVPILTLGSADCVFLLGLTDSCFEPNAINELEFIFTMFATQYHAIRSKSYRDLALSVANESLRGNRHEFFKKIEFEIREYFRGNTLSIWRYNRVRQDELTCEHATDPDLLGRSYKIGEGATGGTFSMGSPILTHRLSDLRSYGIDWKGKHPSDRINPNENNHAIFAPLKIVNATGDQEDYGIARLVSKATEPSFWPYDLTSFQTIAELLAQKFNQEIFINQLRDDKERLRSVLKLTQNVLRLEIEGNFDESAFDSLVEIFLSDIIGLSLVKRKDSTEFEFLFSTSPDHAQIDLKEVFSNADRRHNHIYHLIAPPPVYDRYLLHLAPRESLESQVSSGFLIIDFDTVLAENDFPYLILVRNILQVAWENKALYDERNIILEKWERTEAAQRAGMVAQEFVHEIRNSIKGVQIWITNAKASKDRPSFESLEEPISKLSQFSDAALRRSTIGYHPKFVIVNEIIQKTLKTYGVDLNSKTKLKNHSIGITLDNALGKKSNWRVFVDPDALVSVLRNLITNSIDQYALIRKSGLIEIESQLISGKEHNEATAHIRIRDFAGGVSPEIRNDMFKPFVTGRPNGSGVGLASAQSIVVKSMAGTIEETGTYGIGACFEITLDAKRI